MFRVILNDEHIIQNEYIFLKTIIPSRQAAKAFKKEKGEKNEIF